MADRALVFIDGNNWYHALGNAGVEDRARLDYRKISEKLLGPREWVGTRYYIGQVNQKYNAALYAQQRSFLANLESTDPRLSVHLGRIEPRTTSNEAAKELREYLGGLTARLDPTVFAELSAIAKRHEQATVFVEKAVDVFLAVDVVSLAISDTYDAAYLLTADGDYTPAVDAVRKLGKKVYAACPSSGAQLAKTVNSFIHLQPSWFDDCYR
ncbi:MAG TPA: NYN domain-containing protein [Thermoanaerobaculia bacterium]|nr:NYN domain-containing protein [Thermoanaerobaculia bacterium]